MQKPKVGHYNKNPSGVECIDIVKRFNFCLGNAIKYIWRAGIKTDDSISDFKKAIDNINFEIDRIVSEKKALRFFDEDVDLL